MGSDDGAGIILGVVVLLLAVACVIGCGIGRWIENGKWQRTSVQAGHAEYVVGEDGGSVWQWKSVAE